MNAPVENLFAGLPGDVSREHILSLVESGRVRIERIISNGKASPPGFWYDQDDNEWVTLLCGGATLEFIDGTEISLIAGDHLLIPARQKHRVKSTSADAIWLAVHFPEKQ